VQAGIYLSVLQQADLRKNTNLEKIGSQYQGFDLGLKLGGEIELPVTNYLSVAPGLFFSLGIPNIYKGYGDIPGYMRRTRNGNESLHITFYYHFN